MFSLHIQEQPIDLSCQLPLQQHSGALVRFVGTVRDSPAGAPLSHLLLEHFAGVTEAQIQIIIEAARQRWPLHAMQVVHRIGRIAPGEPIVLVETASAHRRDAYEANMFVMDYLKTRAPFWKQECFTDGHAHWVEARDSDQAACQLWSHEAAPAAPIRRVGALILAGGQGRRMGGVNKGLQLLHGLPLVQHVLQAVRPQLDYIAISANHDLPRYRALGAPVFSDTPDLLGRGPLAGLASAAPALPPDLDALLIVPCDTPMLPPDLVARLAGALFSAGAAPAAIAATAEGLQPSIALFRPALLLGLPATLHTAAADADLSLRGWLTRHGHVSVHFDDAAAFVNLNDRHSLAKLQQTPTGTAPASRPFPLSSQP